MVEITSYHGVMGISPIDQEDQKKKTRVRRKHEGIRLPLARIKTIMRQDSQDVEWMIGIGVPELMAAMVNAFICDLTRRTHAELVSTNRRTITKADLVNAVKKDNMFYFAMRLVLELQQ